MSNMTKNIFPNRNSHLAKKSKSLFSVNISCQGKLCTKANSNLRKINHMLEFKEEETEKVQKFLFS